MFGGSSERSFHKDLSINNDIELKWSFQTTGSQGNTSIIIYKDILFITDLSGKIYGLDRLTGKLIGNEKYTGSIPIAPVINGVRMFFIVNNLHERFSTFILYDLAGGKILSESKIIGGVNNEMLKLDDGIIVLSDSGELIKFNLVGQRLWSVESKINCKVSPASDGEVIVFGNEKGELITVSADNGETIYRKKICGEICGDFTTDGINTYFGENSGILFSVRMADGKINWAFDTKNKILSSPVLNESQIMIGNLAGDICCLSSDTGIMLWKLTTGGVINTAPLLTKNFLIQPDYNRKIYFIGPQTGKIEKTLDFEGRVKLSPVWYDGILYLGSDKGKLDAYAALQY